MTGRGREWYGALANCGPLAKDSAKLNTQKAPTKYAKPLKGYTLPPTPSPVPDLQENSVTSCSSWQQ